MLRHLKTLIVKDIDGLIKDFVDTRDRLHDLAREEKAKALKLQMEADVRIERAVRAENIAGKLHEIVR